MSYPFRSIPQFCGVISVSFFCVGGGELMFSWLCTHFSTFWNIHAPCHILIQLVIVLIHWYNLHTVFFIRFSSKLKGLIAFINKIFYWFVPFSAWYPPWHCLFIYLTRKCFYHLLGFQLLPRTMGSQTQVLPADLFGSMWLHHKVW